MLPYKWWAWDKARQRKGQQGQQGLETWHVSSHLVCFFSFTYLSTKCLFALSLLWWWPPPPPPHTISISITKKKKKCRLETQLHLEFWYVIFFHPLLNNYLLLDCMYGTATRTTMANGHHLWDNKRGLKMHHLYLKSLVCFFFFSFFFFFFHYSFNLPTHPPPPLPPSATGAQDVSHLEPR